MNTEQDFVKWACNYSGIDGGDLTKSEYWLVGIEFATGGSAENDFIKKCESGFISVNEPADTFTMRYWAGNSFNSWVQKFCYALIKSTAHEDIGKWHTEIINNTTPGEDGIYYYPTSFFGGNNTEQLKFYKFNLFPIPFPKDEDDIWESYYKGKDINLYDITGFATKECYREFCFKKRLPELLAKLYDRNDSKHLKIVVAGRKNQYGFKFCKSLEAALSKSPYRISSTSGNIQEKQYGTYTTKKDNKKRKRWYSYKTFTINDGNGDRRISVINTPFLNRAGDHEAIANLAKKINELQ